MKSEMYRGQLGENVAVNVRFWRLVRRMDQQGLADALADVGWRIDRPTVAKIEGGHRKVTVDELDPITRALDVPLTVLLSRCEYQPGGGE